MIVSMQNLPKADESHVTAIRIILTFVIGAFGWEELFDSRGAPWVFDQPQCLV